MARNLFTDIPPKLADELVEIVAQGRGVRIERIVSTGHASPPDFWYEQEEAEWVAVLQGEAQLTFDDDPSPTQLQPGDYVFISAGRKHRVDWTSENRPTIWLAVFFCEDE